MLKDYNAVTAVRLEPAVPRSRVKHSIIALKASGRDCTNNNELLHKIGVLQRYDMHLFVFTSEF